MGLLHHPFWLQFVFGTFVTSLFNFLIYFIWLRITDEGSVPEMRIWFILLLKLLFYGFITPPLLASVCFGTSDIYLFNFSNYFVWLRIIDVGSVPEMRIWSISLINSYDIYNFVEVSFHIAKPGLYTDSKSIPCELFAKYMPKAQCYADPSFS